MVFQKKQPEAPGIITFYFQPEHELRYTAGQFIELTVQTRHGAEKKKEKHWFTLSSSPTEELLSITTRVPPKDASDFKRALNKLQPGDTLDMSDAMGDFVLPKLVQTPLLFVAGGIGITPMRSMLTWLADTMEERPIELLWAVRSEEDIIFQPILDRAGQHATIVVEDPSPAWGGERGRLNAEMILGIKQPTPDTLIYLSGPDPFVDAMKAQLLKANVPQSQLVTDGFIGYKSI